MDSLTITLIQADLIWENVQANLAQFSAKLQSLAPSSTDLVVLPEMFTTGFTMNPSEVAEDMEGSTIAWMRTQAARLDAAIVGSFVAKEAGKYFNRLCWMFPDGTCQLYDKRHLFTLAKEHLHYTAGTEKLIVDYRGWKICPLICYDLRFPVWSRNTEGYDLLLYIANFPERRRHAWNSLLIARAIENQVYTIGINRVGTDNNDIYYSGDSVLLDYQGEARYRVAHVEQMATFSLSLKEQQHFRKKLAFLPDQDRFQVL